MSIFTKNVTPKKEKKMLSIQNISLNTTHKFSQNSSPKSSNLGFQSSSKADSVSFCGNSSAQKNIIVNLWSKLFAHSNVAKHQINAVSLLEREDAISLMAKNASEFWTKLLHIPSNSTLESNPTKYMDKFFKFDGELQKIIKKELNNRPNYFSMSVDYLPDSNLAMALKKAKINESNFNFPTKTYLTIMDGEITTSQHSKPETLYQLPEHLKAAIKK